MKSKKMETLKFDKRPRHHIAPACPCGKSNRDGKFTPFTGETDKGYCHACGQTFLPEIEKDPISNLQKIERKPEPLPSYIKTETFKASLTRYEFNSFVQFLLNAFGHDLTNKAIAKYFIGTTRKAGTAFWQIDKQGNIRSGKIIAYDPNTGHRLKDVSPVWVHTEMKLPGFTLKQCLFGEHLLKGNTKPAAVVESEKTSIVASLYFPDFLWLASGGKDGLQTSKMQSLKGRKVILFPDLDGFELWTQRAQELAPMLDIRVSDLLERKATAKEREGKLDIADYLLKFPISEFQKPKETSKPKIEYDFARNLIDPVKGYPVTWDIQTKEISTLEKMILKNPAIKDLIERFDLQQLN